MSDVKDILALLWMLIVLAVFIGIVVSIAGWKGPVFVTGLFLFSWTTAWAVVRVRALFKNK